MRTTLRVLPVLALAGAGLGWATGPGPQPDMTRDLTPFLMFEEGRAEDAIRFYVSLVPGSSIEEIVRWEEGEAEGLATAGQVKLARFSIGGLPVRASDSPISHEFDFTPSLSLFLTCEDDDEIERLAAALLEGGSALMPLGDYGFSRRFTWIVDRFGVSWQLNLE